MPKHTYYRNFHRLFLKVSTRIVLNQFRSLNLFKFKMILRWKAVRDLTLAVFMPLVFAATFVLSSPTPGILPKNYDLSLRHPKTLNMTMMGMGFLRDMIQNGIPFRPGAPPQFPSLKNLFKSNGTNLSWVPLGSLIFNNNGKIIGG